MGGSKGGTSTISQPTYETVQVCNTTGYKYYAGLHLVFCHAIDKMMEILVGEKTAWEGEITGNTTIEIDQAELHGGEDREGGLKGSVDVCFGAADQEINTYLKDKCGADTPAYRGLFGLVAKKCFLAANNPYIKEWAVLAERTKTGWQDDLAGIEATDGYLDMNPVHIIHETLTNTSWGGLGYPEADLDEESFIAAANTMIAEEFGLALVWSDNTAIEDFLASILSHIDGVLFFSHVTGLLTLKLVRGDYSKAMLPLLDPSNVIDLVEFTVPSATETVNQITIKWCDRNNDDKSVSVHDIAGINRAGGRIISATMDFPGIATEELAQRVASRELQQSCVPIASCTLVVNRKNWDLEPGDCFRFSWGEIGIEEMIMRVGSVEIGLHTESQLRIVAVRDTYGLGPIAITEPATSAWVNPINAPQPAIHRKVVEMTWWQYVQAFGETDSAKADLTESSTWLIAMCAPASSDSFNYELWTMTYGGTAYKRVCLANFTDVYTAATDIPAEITTVMQTEEGSLDASGIMVGGYAVLGDELVAITAIDAAAGTLTLMRGILDSIPVAHEAGTRIWCSNKNYSYDTEERLVDEIVELRMLPSTSKGRLLLADAPVDSYTCVGRLMRPYPPGNVQVNGERWPEEIGAAAELTVSWSHRDRISQTAGFIPQNTEDIGPEDGVTYTLRIYGQTDTMLRTESGLTETSYTYAAADELADSGFTELNTSLRFELESERDGLTSLEIWNLAVVRATE